MANSYYNTVKSFLRGTLARGADVKAEFDGVEAAFDASEAIYKRAIKLPVAVTTDQVITEDSGARANMAVGFDSSGDLRLFDTTAVTDSVIGGHSQFIPAGAMRPTITNGCASVSDHETTAGRPDITYLAFDKDSDEHARFSFRFPEQWNAGTITFIPEWTHTTGGTTFGVAWALKAVAISNGDTFDVAYGTAQTSVDTGGTAETKYAGPESSAITIGGSPAKNDLIEFLIFRDVSDAGDTLDIDAWLTGVEVIYTIDEAKR